MGFESLSPVNPRTNHLNGGAHTTQRGRESATSQRLYIGLNPYAIAVPVLETSHSEFEVDCPQNRTAEYTEKGISSGIAPPFRGRTT